MSPDGFYSESGEPNPPRPDELVDLYDYWVRIAGDEEMPNRRAFDPAAIHKLLPYLVLTEVTHDPVDFIYRLVGDHIVTHAHRSIQGLRLSDLANRGNERDRELQAHLSAIGFAVVTTRSPIFADLSYLTIPDAARKLLQTTCLPLANDDGRISHIICAAVYQDQPKLESDPAPGSFDHLN